MGDCILYGKRGGGNQLNFKVVGGTSAPPSISRNMFPYPFYNTTMTKHGITFTDNGDGSITANGTATKLSVFDIWGTENSITVPGGTYTLSGCPSGGDLNTGYCLCSNDTSYADTGDGITFTLSAETAISFKIRIASGATLSNVVFKPQLELGSTKTEYVKYNAGLNTVWVNTDQTITSWDFNTTEPENPVEGMVWFYTGSLGTVSFDALKKNSLILNTLFTKQYISEAWVSKTVKVYQNDEWADLWNGEFFENGTFHVMHTKYTVPETAPISEASDGITMSTVASKTSEVYVVFGPVSLDNISTLQMTSAFIDSISGTHRRVLFISKSADTSYKNAEAITNSSVTSGYKNSIAITLDVSSFTGEYYVYAGQNTNGSSWDNARTLKITEVTSVDT